MGDWSPIKLRCSGKYTCHDDHELLMTYPTKQKPEFDFKCRPVQSLQIPEEKLLPFIMTSANGRTVCSFRTREIMSHNISMLLSLWNVKKSK